MAKDRLSLHNKLVQILGSSNVYFQPPASVLLKYPCIIYKLDDVEKIYANDRRYLGTKMYLITIVDKNPDSSIPDKILDLPYSSFEDYMTIDNLNHFICSLHW